MYIEDPKIPRMTSVPAEIKDWPLDQMIIFLVNPEKKQKYQKPAEVIDDNKEEFDPLRMPLPGKAKEPQSGKKDVFFEYIYR